MDRRRIDAARAPSAATRLSELRPSTRDFTQYLGVGRSGIAIVPLVARQAADSDVAIVFPEDLAGFIAAADELEIGAFAVASNPSADAVRLDDLRVVSSAGTAPVLRFDAIADEREVYESRAAGADAVLVPLARSGDALPGLLGVARALHMAVVAEVASEAECRAAVDAGALVIALAATRLSLASEIPERYPLLALDAADEPENLAPLLGVVDGVVLGRAIFAARDPLARLRAFVDAAAALPVKS